MYCFAIKVCKNLLSHSIQCFSYSRYVTVNYRQQETADNLQIIPDYDQAYDPPMYPSIFPNGDDGWHCGLDHSYLQHTSYELMD